MAGVDHPFLGVEPTEVMKAIQEEIQAEAAAAAAAEQAPHNQLNSLRSKVQEPVNNLNAVNAKTFAFMGTQGFDDMKWEARNFAWNWLRATYVMWKMGGDDEFWDAVHYWVDQPVPAEGPEYS
jgi:2'-5' RNA ligase